MKHRFRFSVVPLLIACIVLPRIGLSKQYNVRSGGLAFSIDDATGAYALDARELHFAGRLPGGASHVSSSANGLGFMLADGIEASVAPAPGKLGALLFSWKVVDKRTAMQRPAFPDFDTVPGGLHSLSHRQLNFAPPVFDSAQDVSTPWVLFDGTGPRSSSRLQRISLLQACLAMPRHASRWD